jgi:lipopolysaccharide transport system permease protein
MIAGEQVDLTRAVTHTPAGDGRNPVAVRQPLIRIRAGRRPGPIDAADLWAHRWLLFSLIRRDLKVRYKQTLLGAAWVVLQPLLLTAVFTLFLGKVVRVPSGGVPYPLFLYAGLLPWGFFSGAVTTGSNSIVANAYMVTKVYFPRAIIPAAAIGVRLADFLVAAVVFVFFMIYYHVPVTAGLLLAPLLVAHLTLLTWAVTLWLSALNVRYRDVSSVLPVLLQLWMFASPIVYPPSLVSARFRWAYELNPLVGIVENLRASLLGLGFDWRGLAVSAAVTTGLLAAAAYAFWRMEDEFADIV